MMRDEASCRSRVGKPVKVKCIEEIHRLILIKEVVNVIILEFAWHLVSPQKKPLPSACEPKKDFPTRPNSKRNAYPSSTMSMPLLALELHL